MVANLKDFSSWLYVPLLLRMANDVEEILDPQYMMLLTHMKKNW